MDRTKISIVDGIGGFARGFFSVWNAWRFISKNPSLYKYIVLPLIINIVVFSGAIYWGGDLFSQFTGQYFSPQDAWYWHILALVVDLFAVVMALVVVFFAFTVVGNLIAAPFNDLLSEKTEQLLLGNLIDEPFSFRQLGKDIFRVMRDEVRKMAIFVGLMLVAFTVNLLPGVGSFIYMVISVGLTLYFLIIEYTGYVFSRKHLGFKDQRRFIAQNRLGALGFGLAVMCLLFIPFVQLLTIPLAVVAATELCCCDRP